MESFSNINGNGQVLFIEPTWVTGETCLFTVQNRVDYAIAKAKLTKIRQKFIERLEREGFVICYDRANISDDVVYFVMNPESVFTDENDISGFKKKFDQNIFDFCEGKLNYHIP